MPEKYLTVNGARKHVKDYARAKENEWSGTGLFEACVEVLYNMHEPYDELLEIAENEINDSAADATECADFINSISDEIATHAKISREKSIAKAVAIVKLLKKSCHCCKPMR